MEQSTTYKRNNHKQRIPEKTVGFKAARNEPTIAEETVPEDIFKEEEIRMKNSLWPKRSQYSYYCLFNTGR